MLSKLWQIRAELGEFHQVMMQGMDWYKKEMDNLKNQLYIKDKEIADLKNKLNEQSSK